MIEVAHLYKSFGTRRALQDVSFTAPAGKVTGFVGPNGAGKSTVMRIAAGLIAADSGAVRIAGSEFRRAASPASTMGVFLSADWIPNGLTARSVLEYACMSQGLPHARAAHALDLVGLSDVANTKAGSFSLGMRQRLGIAALTIGQPSILMLDEPVNGLDPDGIHWFRTFVSQAAQGGATVLLSSHHMAELALLADRVVIIVAGRIVTEGPLSEVIADEAPVVYATSPNSAVVCKALASAGYSTKCVRDGFVVYEADPLEVGRIAFATGIGVSQLELVSRSLEDKYFDAVSNAEGGPK